MNLAILDKLNNTDTGKLLQGWELRTFVRVDHLKAFVPNQPSPYWFFYLTRKPLETLPLQVVSELVLPIGKLYTIGNQSIACGYLYESPTHRLIQHERCIGIVRREGPYSDVRVFYNDRYLKIMHSKDDALTLLAVTKERWIARHGYHSLKDGFDDNQN